MKKSKHKIPPSLLISLMAIMLITSSCFKENFQGRGNRNIGGNNFSSAIGGQSLEVLPQKDLRVAAVGECEAGEEHCLLRPLTPETLDVSLLPLFEKSYVDKRLLSEGPVELWLHFTEEGIAVYRLLDKKDVEKSSSSVRQNLVPYGEDMMALELFQQKAIYNHEGQSIEVSAAKEGREMVSLVERPSGLIEKRLINQTDTFIYLPSVQSVSTIAAQIMGGHFQENPLLVRFKLTENALQIFKIDDLVYLDKEMGSSHHDRVKASQKLRLIGSFPIRHVDYKKKRDSLGKRSLAEVEDSSVNWKERRYIVIDSKSLKTWGPDEDHGMLMLPLQECTQEIFTELDVADFFQEYSDSIFLKIRKHYQLVSGRCLDILPSDGMYGMENKIEMANFHLDFVHSFKKLDSLRSPDYVPVDYPLEDQRHFGFFATRHDVFKERHLDDLTKEEKYFLKRWNPDRKVITMTLSPAFKEEKNKNYLLATKKSLQIINEGLAKAKIDLKVELAKKGDDFDYSGEPGSLNKNTIILEEDQLGSIGLLGYCPSVADPLTGEIVNSQISIYPGSMKQLVRRYYNEIVYAENYKVINNHLIGRPVADEASRGLTQDKKEGQAILSKEKEKIANYLKDKKDILRLTEIKKIPQTIGGPIDLSEHLAHISEQSLGQFKEQILTKNESFKNFVLRLDKQRSRQEALSEHVYTAEDLHLDDFGKNSPTIMFRERSFDNKYHTLEPLKVGDRTVLVMKYWDSLSSETQEVISEKMQYMMFLHTFVHEFGHGLGLRHNFMSKFDHHNFYDHKEDSSPESFAKDYPLDIPRFSSVMDYGITFKESLSTFGKYDIAALKFAYRRAVDVADEAYGKKSYREEFLGHKTLQDFITEHGHSDVRYFAYCTDEDKAHDPLFCTTHMVGRNLSELSQHLKDKYRLITELYTRNVSLKHQYNETEDQLGYYYKIFEIVMKLKQIAWLDFSKTSLIQHYCSHAKENIKNRFLCDQYKSIEGLDIASNIHTFFSTEMGMQDHTCLIKKHASDEVIGSHYLEETFQKVNRPITDETLRKEDIVRIPLEKLFTLYDDFAGKDLAQVSSYPNSCFDPRIQEALSFIKEEKRLKKDWRGLSAIIDDKQKELTESVKFSGAKKVSLKEQHKSLTIVGEYGRSMNDYTLSYSKGAIRNELAVRGAWMNKFIMAYLAAVPLSASLTHLGEDSSRMMSAGEIYNSPDVNNVLEQIILGRRIESPIATAGRIRDPQRNFLTAHLDFEPITVSFKNAKVAQGFGFKSDQIDLHKAMVSIMHDIYSSYANDGDEEKKLAIKEKKRALEYLITDAYNGERPADFQGEPLLVYKDYRSQGEGQKWQWTGINYYAGDYNIYAKQLLECGKDVQDSLRCRSKFAAGDFDEAAFDKERSRHFLWGVQYKDEYFRDLDAFLDTESVCGNIAVEDLFSSLASLGKILKSKGPYLKTISYFSDLLQKMSLNDSSVQMGEKLKSRWPFMESNILFNGKCRSKDYFFVATLLKLVHLNFSPVENVMDDIEYAHFMELHGVRSHLTFLGEELLSKYEESLKREGIYQTRRASDKNDNSDQEVFEFFISYMGQLFDDLEKSDNLKEQSFELSKLFANYTEAIAKLSSLELSAKTAYLEMVYLAGETSLQFPYTEQAYRDSEKVRIKLFQEVQVALKEKIRSLAFDTLSLCKKEKNVCAEESVEFISDLYERDAIQLDIHKEEISASDKRILEDEVYWIQDVRKNGLLKEMATSFIENKEYYISRIKKERELLKRSVLLPQTTSQLLKLKKIISFIDAGDVQKLVEALHNLFTMYDYIGDRGQISFALISRDLELLSEYNSLKNNQVGESFFSLNKKINEKLSMKDFEAFRPNFVTLKASYNRHRLDDDFKISESRLTTLIPVHIK